MTEILFLGTPKNINYNAVKGVLENIQGVVAAHSLHIWSLTVNKAALAVHLAVGKYLSHLSLSILWSITIKLGLSYCDFHKHGNSMAKRPNSF